ncbi:MAG: DUF4350 domain-containing protein [Actinobacteria bacterium]|nr:DUF4350 domain-containing protein [Actinomycetota bacterium]
MSANRRRGLGVLAVVVVLGAILALSRPRQDPWARPALDPRATNPQGLAALVALLREEGATVRLGGLPDPRDDVVLQVKDTLGAEPNRRLDRWVRSGGRLVTTDPTADLAQRAYPPLHPSTDSPGVCTIGAVRPVRRLGVDVSPTFRLGGGQPSCFSDGELAWLVVSRRGAGVVVSAGGPEPFVNGALAEGDDAVLAVALLAPRRGTAVRILDPYRFLGDTTEVGDGTVLGALPARGRQAVVLLVAAFALWGLAKGRRLGRPVPEVLPVPLPASDLVLSTGELLARRRDAADAAERLRRRAARDMGSRLGLGPDPDRLLLAEATIGRTGTDPDLARRALLAPVFDDDELVQLISDLDRLREDLHGRATAV